MNINLKTVQGVTVAEISGELAYQAAVEAEPVLVQAVRPGGDLILDLSGVPSISTRGVRVLLIVYRQAANTRGRSVLVGLTPFVKDVLTVTGLLDFIPHHETLQAGLASLADAPAPPPLRSLH